MTVSPRHLPAAGAGEADWRDDAACRKEDPELFFPKTYGPPAAMQIGDAMAVCNGCPSRLACLADAMADEGNAGRATRDGIRGGYTPGQRRQVYDEALRRAETGEEGPVEGGWPVLPETGPELAACGTRSAYQRHVKKREPIDEACRQANREASTRLRQTGTTRVLAS